MHSPLDVFGLRPLKLALSQTRTALFGMEGVPPSRFGPSSLKIFFPRLALATWLGKRPGGERVLVTNLFNHTQTPPSAGWSVRKTQARDFRGRGMTYDSHNGTDFTCPVGTVVVAPAPGHVVRVSREFHRGGLKVVLDHGEGLMTTSNHLMSALVAPGQVVRRGEPIALSGASGLDCVAAFPWNAPHVHFNVWLDGLPVDPFAADPRASLWRGGSAPGAALPDPAEEVPTATRWDEGAITALLASCTHEGIRAEIEAEAALQHRSANTIFYSNYFPTLFAAPQALVATPHPRRPRLDLPFADFRGMVFADEL